LDDSEKLKTTLFLAFYQDRRKHAFQTRFFSRQSVSAKGCFSPLFNQVTLVDFLFVKDRFADTL
jgi:hypothetical protein